MNMIVDALLWCAGGPVVWLCFLAINAWFRREFPQQPDYFTNGQLVICVLVAAAGPLGWIVALSCVTGTAIWYAVHIPDLRGWLGRRVRKGA